ncbi:MAG: alpha/beta hydrolase family protein [Caulobacteraceae bacterium]
MKLLALALFLLILAPASARAQVGFEEVHFPGPFGNTLLAGIWYPTRSPASAHKLGTFTQDVAPGAAIAGRDLPLVVMSHGSGGWYGGHYDTALALARAGFVVAAVTHAGDSYQDPSRAIDIDRRPRQLEALIDYMLGSWPGAARLDPKRLGAFGFSAGGFTVLVLAGGVPSLSRFPSHVRAHPTWFDSSLWLKASPGERSTALRRMRSASDWAHDPTIRAAVVAAPALGFAFGRQGLARVRVPVQLWRAGADQVLPNPDYAEAVRRDLLRPPQYHVVANARHYDFLAPCDPILAKAAHEICFSRPGFDRPRFHRQFDESVVTFFRRTLMRSNG